jgi:hypothetical protein
MIVEQMTCNSLNAFTEWFLAGFTRVTDAPTNEEDRSEVYDIDSSVQKPVLGHFKKRQIQTRQHGTGFGDFEVWLFAKSRPAQLS